MRSRANVDINFQRRHFECIARAIASCPEGLSRQELAEHFANRIGWTNPHFQRDKFIRWAMGDERSVSDLDREMQAEAKAAKLAARQAKAEAQKQAKLAKAETKYYAAVTRT
jgi:hypothetical protein